MNKSIRNKSLVCVSLIAVVLVVDQWLKIWIKTNFPIGGAMNLIGDWCRFYFVENQGIAFGLSFGEGVGKLLLTLFRLVASGFVAFLLVKYLKRNERYTLILSMALIFVGAVGNLVDSCVYGLVFSESTHEVIATLFPAGGGYGTFMHGRVVDMFYFPICHWIWPEWMPLVGGTEGEFFNAIFNVADAAVCMGVLLLIIDQAWVEPRRKRMLSADVSDGKDETLNEDPEPGTVEN